MEAAETQIWYRQEMDMVFHAGPRHSVSFVRSVEDLWESGNRKQPLSSVEYRTGRNYHRSAAIYDHNYPAAKRQVMVGCWMFHGMACRCRDSSQHRLYKIYYRQQLGGIFAQYHHDPRWRRRTRSYHRRIIEKNIQA